MLSSLTKFGRQLSTSQAQASLSREFCSKKDTAGLSSKKDRSEVKIVSTRLSLRRKVKILKGLPLQRLLSLIFQRAQGS